MNVEAAAGEGENRLLVALALGSLAVVEGLRDGEKRAAIWTER
ncbi:hypothetical protein ACFXPT_37950 [Streptomyces goshikiensis]